MRIERAKSWRSLTLIAVALAVGLIFMGSTAAFAEEFREGLARVDRALTENPKRVGRAALFACKARRDRAAELFMSGQITRAERGLKFCFHLLGIPAEGPPPKPPADPDKLAKQRAAALAEIRKHAEDEFDTALALTPNVENGLVIYRGCAACHTPEGWGLASGVVPQLAGQHRKVVIKQLADIRSGNRENRVMDPYSSAEAIGGAQAVADVAGYIDTLEISIENGKGSGEDLALGERLYEENCLRCHGQRGEGDNEKQIPRIQAQHYGYLVVQFELIRDGKRRNANPEMVAQIKKFGDREIQAVTDYVARLEPPEELQAPPGWRNPDFTHAVEGD